MFSKGTWWFTVTPDAAASCLIFFFAMGPDKPAEEIRSKMHNTVDRYRILGEHPGACALFFRRFMQIIIHHVFGWDADLHACLRRGGIFGHLINWAMAIEQQSSQNLHAHCLLWAAALLNMGVRLTRDMHTEFVNDVTDFIDMMQKDVLSPVNPSSPDASTATSMFNLWSELASEERMQKDEQQAQLLSLADDIIDKPMEPPLQESIQLPPSQYLAQETGEDNTSPQRIHDVSTTSTEAGEDNSTHDLFARLGRDLHSGSTPSDNEPDLGPSLGPSPTLNELRKGFVEHLDACVQCELQLPLSVQDGLMVCLQKDCDGILLEICTPEDYKRLRSKPAFTTPHGKDPCVLECTKCHEKCGALHLLKRALAESGELLGVHASNVPGPDPFVSEENKWLHHLRCFMGGDSMLDDLCAPSGAVPSFDEEDDHYDMHGWSVRDAFPSELTAAEHKAIFYRPAPCSTNGALDNPLMPRGGDIFDLDLPHQDLLVNCMICDQQIHDPNHRGRACFSKKGGGCRYNSPYSAESEGYTHIEMDEEGEHGFVSCLVIYKRRPVFMYLSSTCRPVHYLGPGNNFNRFIKDVKLTYYYTAYKHKDQTKDTESLRVCVSNLRKYIARTKAQDLVNPDEQKSAYSKGLGRLLSAHYHYGSVFTVGAYFAAYFNDGGERFVHAYPHANYYLVDFVNYLDGAPVGLTLEKDGAIKAWSEEYIRRPHELESYCSYDFCSVFFSLRRTKIGQRRHGTDYWDYHSGFTNSDKFVCAKRECLYVPLTYAGGRLPDKKLIEGPKASDQPKQKLDASRKLYAITALAMTIPFRKPSDLRDDNESWWDAYLRQVASLPDTDVRVVRLNNIQMYYESFFRGH